MGPVPWAGTGLCQLPPRAIPFPAWLSTAQCSMSLDLQGKAPGDFHQQTSWVLPQNMEEGEHRAGLAHLCQHAGFWPVLKLAVPAQHGGGGRSGAGWKALVSRAWHGCGRREGAVLAAPRRSHRSCHHVPPPFWQPQPAWPSSAVKKAEQAPGLVLPPETA